jgi:hypothetical protein
MKERSACGCASVGIERSFTDQCTTIYGSGERARKRESRARIDGSSELE